MSGAQQTSEPLLELREVRTHFPIYEGAVFKRRAGAVAAVDGVDLEVRRGEILGLVGESGCGKSTLARTVLRLAPITSGAVLFQGRNLAGISRGEMRALRPQLQMIFQDPYASLNPRLTVYEAIAEPLVAHRIVPRGAVSARVGELMELVGLGRDMARKYPHEFSGGQRQRIAIARALALEPKLIIADEPVSALDVSVQAQILNLLARLCRQVELTLILISHDLAVVQHLANRIAVMYLGKIVEIGPAETVFHRPAHPYSRALINAIPLPDPSARRDRRLILQGDPPSPMNPPSGCPFHPRCPFAEPACAETLPELRTWDESRRAACIRLEDLPPFQRA